MKWDSILPRWSLFAYTPFVINFSTFPFFLFIEKKKKTKKQKNKMRLRNLRKIILTSSGREF